MSVLGKIMDNIAIIIKMDDRMAMLTNEVKNLTMEVQNINNRVIRIETFIEFAEKHRAISSTHSSSII